MLSFSTMHDAEARAGLPHHHDRNIAQTRAIQFDEEDTLPATEVQFAFDYIERLRGA